MQGQPQQRPPQQPQQPQPQPQQAPQQSQRPQSDSMSLQDVRNKSMSDKSAKPHPLTIDKAVDHSLKTDKPIILTFWQDSLVGNVFFLHNKKDKEINIYKSEEEYTSPLVENGKITMENGELICETENSLYIVSNQMTTKTC
jgi:hypothetical protein